jgi:hypothetical protein
MPAFDPLSLNFDTYERLGAMAGAVGVAGLAHDAWLLDVGGHPGLLATMLDGRRVVTADIPPSGPLPYVRVAGASLPFKDNAFAAVLCSDTLEHVPPQFRTGFLSELWRVSRDLIFLGGPFATCGVEYAEMKLREMDQAAHAKTNEWLDEHATHGLPDLARTWSEFERRGAACMALPNGDLIRWFSMFCLNFVCDEIPGGWEALRNFMPSYNAHFARTAPGAPVYRHLLIAAKGGALPEALLAQPHLAGAADAVEDASVHARIDAIYALAAAVRDALRRLAQLGEQSGTLAAAYVAQLEKALRQQDIRQLELRAQLERAQRGGASQRIRRRIAKMLKRNNG